jgi:Fuc2NAc and GlcNAc transferase
MTIWPWVILMGVFAVDATFTLCRRALAGVRVTEAHRSHAYQRAFRRVGNHRAVTLCVLAINTLLLAPASLVAQIWPAWVVPLTIVCWGALSGLAWFLDAGRLDAVGNSG